MKKIPESHQYLIDGAYTAVLTTIMPNGYPHTTPVWCNAERGAILVNTMKGFRKEKNMRLNPQVTLFIYDPQNPFHNIEVRGTVVEMSESGAVEHLDELTRLYLKKADAHFFGDCVSIDLAAAKTPVRIKIEPSRVRVEG